MTAHQRLRSKWITTYPSKSKIGTVLTMPATLAADAAIANVGIEVHTLAFTTRQPSAVGVTLTARCRLSFVRKAKRGQREARETDAEFLQRPAARHGLGQ